MAKQSCRLLARGALCKVVSQPVDADALGDGVERVAQPLALRLHTCVHHAARHLHAHQLILLGSVTRQQSQQLRDNLTPITCFMLTIYQSERLEMLHIITLLYRPEPGGSMSTTLMLGSAALRLADTPAIVPPVPAPFLALISILS